MTEAIDATLKNAPSVARADADGVPAFSSADLFGSVPSVAQSRNGRRMSG